MAKRELIGAFIGVPEEMLYDIGRIVVLGAQLDYRRMRLLETVTFAPIATSASLSRNALTKEIRDALANLPFDRLQDQAATWLQQASDLLGIRDELAHSIGGYETRGDGTARYVRLHPKQPQERLQFTPSRISEFVIRMLDVNDEGVKLELQALTLREHGVAGHKAWLKQREQFELSVQRLHKLDLYAEDDTKNHGNDQPPSSDPA